MASFDLPELPQTRMSPQLLMGVASPLWTYFGAAAAGGVAYWWMTQWARPANLEAAFGRVTALPVSVPEAVEPVVEAVEALVEVAPQLPPEPVGGEAAPVSPLIETAPIVEPEPEPLIAAPPEPILQEPAPFLTEAPSKPRVKKGPPEA